MSDSIIRRLLEDKKKMIFEADDDPDTEFDGEDDPGIPEVDDSLEDRGTEDDFDDMEDDDTERSDRDSHRSPSSSTSPSRSLSPRASTDVTPKGDDKDTPDIPDESEPDHEGYENPLDNHYATKFTLGDEVTMTYNTGATSGLKGTIEGYDVEGFYRVKWESGKITNGLTDTALASLVNKSVAESVCVCGHKDFITEGKYIVCDRCGRRIRESLDNLTVLDKERPKGKRMIRSVPHPISTAIRPDISETIRSAVKSKKLLNEESENDNFDSLRQLDGDFWTRLPELISDIEDLGYTVVDSNAEYIVVEYYDDYRDEVDTLQIPLGGTSRTITLDFSRAREV